MKVSIVTAVRQGATTIQSTVQSVNDQSYSNLEHIFVDGASTDGTAELIRSHTRRPNTLISERDSGIYDAFAKGYRLCTGDVIGYLNSGDRYVHRDVVSKVVERFQTAKVDAVFGDVVIVDERQPSKIVRHYRSSRFTPAKIPYGFMPAHPALFLARRAYQTYGNYDLSYRIAGDFELVVRMFARGRISYSYLDDVLVAMPRGGASTSGPRSNWIITKEMRRACAENGVSTNLVKLLLRFPVKMTEWFRRGNEL